MSAEAPISDCTDKTLVDRLLAGEQAAEFELDRRWRPRLLALARSILQDDGLAEDAAQVAMWRVLHNLRRYDRSRQPGMSGTRSLISSRYPASFSASIRRICSSETLSPQRMRMMSRLGRPEPGGGRPQAAAALCSAGEIPPMAYRSSCCH